MRDIAMRKDNFKLGYAGVMVTFWFVIPHPDAGARAFAFTHIAFRPTHNEARTRLRRTAVVGKKVRGYNEIPQRGREEP